MREQCSPVQSTPSPATHNTKLPPTPSTFRPIQKQLWTTHFFWGFQDSIFPTTENKSKTNNRNLWLNIKILLWLSMLQCTKLNTLGWKIIYNVNNINGECVMIWKWTRTSSQICNISIPSFWKEDSNQARTKLLCLPKMHLKNSVRLAEWTCRPTIIP